MRDVKRILVDGAGMMGKNIAFVLSGGDYDVTVYDVRQVDLAQDIRASAAPLISRGVLTEEELNERLGRVSFTTDLDCPEIAGVDMVIECDILHEHLCDEPHGDQPGS